ncbi:MAG TPA: hypothetical protein VN181_15360, partial [Thermoanaerobaculia bacterium]|nr:hypothetical protein [Thermoanaerobaculia bacterium]
TGQIQFQRGLGRAVKSPGAFPFAKKVMYGSDWHMIHKLKAHRAYLPSFRSALAGSEWDSLRADFFLGNATRWLNLPAYIERMTTKYTDVLSIEGVEHLKSLVAKA